MKSGYKNILVAYDGSDSSRYALDQAVDFARATGAVISAVSAFVPRATLLDSIIGSQVEEAERRFESSGHAGGEKSGQRYPAIEVIEARVTVHEAIITAAQSKGIDLIVMGRRGLNPVERIMVGSVTARVIGYSPIDVLVVPLGAPFRWKRALLATDGSHYSQAAKERALGLALASGIELKVIHVIDVPAELYANDAEIKDALVAEARNIIEPIEREARHLDIGVEGFIEEGIAPIEILRSAQKAAVDFIIIGSHGRTGIERFLMGNVAERVIANDRYPVLVIKGGLDHGF